MSKKQNWITNKRPEKAGEYWVTLEYPYGKYDKEKEEFVYEKINM